MRIKFIESPILIQVFVAGIICICSTNSYAQYSREGCQEQINRLRQIYIVILKKTPGMPPLAQLSPGIRRALDEGERNRDLGNYQACVDETKRNIKIVEGYAR